MTFNNQKNKKNINNKKNTNIIKLNSVSNEINIENNDIESVKENLRGRNKISEGYYPNETSKSKTSINKENKWIINEIYLKDYLISIFYCCKKKKNYMYKILIMKV